MADTSHRQGRIRLALDAGSGDYGAEVTLAAARDAIRSDEHLFLYVVDLPAALDGASDGLTPAEAGRLECVAAESVLGSDVGPASAIRQGARSSLGGALQLVADGRADACVSAGSTTALIALGMKLLGMLPGLKRPALMSAVPSRNGYTSMLDLGANLNVDAVQLVQFAIMGAVARRHEGGPEPSVGLLNVGHEDGKGHAIVREAHERLKQLPLDYRGFIEGNELFTGRVDVAVCDGFSGNLVLKSSEGLARMLLEDLRGSLGSSWRARLGAWVAGPTLRGALARYDPAHHNGAPLLGLNGVVVKSHGSADRRAMLQAIREAGNEAVMRVPGKIGKLIHNYKAEAQL
ncbi:MAG TPA: phosphate acyltransferase PlsX [Xanthomonadales bacterium]|nr:phosphate acyltransferase PlsX [Xanthomonadales bacterium]